MSADFESIIETIAYIDPSKPIADALTAAREVQTRMGAASTVHILTETELDRYARTSPAVMDELRGGKKINAIKELRAAMMDLGGISYAKFGGLKECKESIERISRP